MVGAGLLLSLPLATRCKTKKHGGVKIIRGASFSPRKSDPTSLCLVGGHWGEKRVCLFLGPDDAFFLSAPPICGNFVGAIASLAF